MKKAFAFLFLTCTLFACAKAGNQDKIKFKNQDAEIKMVIKSRGVYQYLIQWQNQDKQVTYYPVNLATEFKQDGLKVVFTGTLLDDYTQIYIPGATDIPEADQKVQNIKIETINKVE